MWSLWECGNVEPHSCEGGGAGGVAETSLGMWSLWECGNVEPPDDLNQPPILAEELWSILTVALPNGSRWKAS